MTFDEKLKDETLHEQLLSLDQSIHIDSLQIVDSMIKRKRGKHRIVFGVASALIATSIASVGWFVWTSQPVTLPEDRIADARSVSGATSDESSSVAVDIQPALASTQDDGKDLGKTGDTYSEIAKERRLLLAEIKALKQRQQQLLEKQCRESAGAKMTFDSSFIDAF